MSSPTSVDEDQNLSGGRPIIFGFDNRNDEGVVADCGKRDEHSWPKTFRVDESGTNVLFDINPLAPPKLFFRCQSNDDLFYVTMDVQDIIVDDQEVHVVTDPEYRDSPVFCEQSCTKQQAFTERIQPANGYTSEINLGHLNIWNSIKLRPELIQGELTELVLQFVVSKSEHGRDARLAGTIDNDRLVVAFEYPVTREGV